MKRLAAALAAVPVAAAAGFMVVLGGVQSSTEQLALQSAACVAPANPGSATLAGGSIDGLNSKQLHFARIITQVGLDGIGRPPLKPVVINTRGLELAIATAKVETDIANLDYGDRDSVGLFQQRPSQGWGTREQLMDPVYSSTAFYEALLRVPRWETLPFTVAAQAVQRSAFPDRYGEHQALAESVVAALTSNAPETDTPPSTAAAAAGTWVYPTYLKTVGTSFRGYAGHTGIDFAVPEGTDIMAVAPGRVTAAGFVTRADGSPSYGWRIEIDHGNGLSSLYAHASELLVDVGDNVDASTLVAKSGNTGRSSGPHLHFELKLNGVPFDPEPFLADNGATLVEATKPAAGNAAIAAGSQPDAGCTDQPAANPAAAAGATIPDAGTGRQDPTTHLTPRSTAIRKAVLANYGCDTRPQPPCVSNVGGWRPNDSVSDDHPTGRAVDVMIGPGGKATGADLTMGNEIAAYVQANADTAGVTYIIWDNKIWSAKRAAEGWRTYCDATRCAYGSDTSKWTPSALHQDHVHISTQQ